LKKTVLFVTELCPWPIRGGELIRSYNLIDGLCLHYNVIVLAPRPIVDCDLLRKVKTWVDLKNIGISSQKFKFKFIPNPRMIRLLRNVYKQFKPHLTWFDYRHWGQYVPVARCYGSKTIMGTHNIQHRIKKQYNHAIHRKIDKLMNYLSYKAEYLHERILFRFFDKIVSVSNVDRRYHDCFVGVANSKLLPNFVNEAWYGKNQETSRNGREIIITANFEAYQNKHGTEWFLTRIWPRVRKKAPSARLKLVGRGSEIFSHRLNNEVGVISAGEVDKVAPFLYRASIAAVPILYGGGSRLKILEALVCGVPVISTKLGAEGINLVSGENCIIEDSADRFADAIVNLLRHPDLRSTVAENGFKTFQKEYGFLINVQRLRKIIEETIE